jgi:hypothetical protein
MSPEATLQRRIPLGSKIGWYKIGIHSKAIIPVEAIVRKIINIRGERVMLDRDLAEMYGVETKLLKRVVRRKN